MAVRWLFDSDEEDETRAKVIPPPVAQKTVAPKTVAPKVVPLPVEPEIVPEIPEPTQPKILTVSQLTAAIKGTLQTKFSSVLVLGEISELKRHSSGHIYFTLKDSGSQIPAVLFKANAQRLKFQPEVGQQYVCRGEIDVYLPHGKYQFIAQNLEPTGIGAQELALRQLKTRLTAEGLFHPARKRKLPRFPRRIGFVTSPTGAAIHDFLQVIRRRFRGVQVFVIPAKVQGPGAAADVVRGIQQANRMQPALDVLVVGRGGGSIEDLWCFNEEPVVRAIFASKVPVVSAVGHEVDVTLADLVADVRALTPTEAAERVVPSAAELLEQLEIISRRLKMSLQSQLAAARRHLELLGNRRSLTHPLDRIHDRARRLDELSLSMEQAIRRKAVRSREALASCASRLEALSPLQVLSRGYSVTQRTDGSLIRETASVRIGDIIHTKIMHGEIASRVEQIKNEIIE